MKDLIEGLQLVCLLIWIVAGIRIAYNGYFIHMVGGTMNNSNSNMNINLKNVENFYTNDKNKIKDKP